MKIWTASLFALMLAPGLAEANGTLGTWYTEKGKVAVTLDHCDAADGQKPKLCGQIAWLKKPHDKSGALKRDTKNDDPGLRDQPWCGLTVITGLNEAKPGVWKGGKFYYPKDGRRYDIEIREGAEELTVYAFLGVKLLGKKERWRRVDDALPACPAD